MKDVRILGVDLGKNSCSIVGLDGAGRVLLRRRTRREGVIALAAKLPGCVVAMEACCGAHHLGRLLLKQGHEVRLMSPEYVRPYVKAQKNDDRDAEAIAEAATRPTMRFVALKSEAQLDVQVLHRVRDRLVGQRTSLTNQIRSILLERGIVVPQGRRSLLEALVVLSSVPDGRRVGTRVQRLLDDMLDQWRALDARIKALDDEFAEMARNDPAARRLATIPGIGVLNATALVAAIGDGRTFSRGRDLSAWLGLVPHQATTGGRPKLLGITKRGSRYLRKLVIQGARAALPSLARTATPLGGWLRGAAIAGVARLRQPAAVRGRPHLRATDLRPIRTRRLPGDAEKLVRKAGSVLIFSEHMHANSLGQLGSSSLSMDLSKRARVLDQQQLSRARWEPQRAGACRTSPT